MKLEIQIYPDYILVEGQKVLRPKAMSFSQWEAGWRGIKSHAEFHELEDKVDELYKEVNRLENMEDGLEEMANLKEKYDALEGKYVALRRGIESALNDAK